jgi:indolepyruvate ferredoxin oxidoreductase alpha subunit
VRVDFEQLARAMGIENTYRVDPYDLKQTENALRAALAVDGPAVVIAERACALLPEARAEWTALEVDPERCNGCGLCFRIGCPAVLCSNESDPKTGRLRVKIDPLLCTGCNICAQVCARGAILGREEILRRQEARS